SSQLQGRSHEILFIQQSPVTVSAARARAFILFLNTGTYNPTWGKTLINPLSRCELAGCFDFQ
ncbi:hypothetical protein QIH53_26730, partial [Klebsiella pneumoniae]|nr:hypothetical protein [Klebsiella pneumoniae]